jgi:two-component system, OmpR family, KDP operon response regulator KdpE
VIGQLRRWYQGPIIALSGRNGPGDKIGALDAGADDYVTTPFAMGELLARLRATLRRTHRGTGGPPVPVTIGRWRVDLAGHQVTRAADAAAPPGRAGTLRLTPTEWAILEMLLQHPGQLVSSARLLSGVRGPEAGRHLNYLRFHLAHLRRKLEDDPARPRHLLTEPGMGYRCQP